MTVVSEEPSASGGGPPPASKPAFRGDIDGLRALAIVLVVAYHAGLPFVDGGFVGVDVFFVISGYLITRNLIAESDRDGRISLARFWARRIRRLVPAMAVLVIATLVASLLILPAIRIDEVVREGRAATVYLSNVLFAIDLGDYFDGEVANSPFLHTWSLGVEEQFYVLWPVLVGVAALVARRLGAAMRTVLGWSFGIVLVGSFALSLSLTADGSPWAFYGLQSRTWEFAVAGVLALVGPRLAGGRWPRQGAALLGLALILGAAVLLDGEIAYPGVWALFPVVGTALIVLAGEGGESAWPGISSTFAREPLQWVGRVSYSWYLWHWPFIVLAAEAIDPGRTVAVGAALASLAVAAAMYHWFENPVRFSPWLVGSLARTYLLGAALTVVALAAGFGVAAIAEANRTDLDTMLVEAAADARQETCTVEQTSPSGIEYCEGGDLDAERSVLLVGDSHARHWTGAMDAAASEAGVRLYHRWRGACPALDVDIAPGEGGEEIARQCESHRADTRQLVGELQPDVVVLSNAFRYQDRTRVDGTSVPASEAPAVWEAALAAEVAALRDAGAVVAVIEDNPHLPSDPVACVSESRDVEACRVTSQQALVTSEPIREAVAAVTSAQDVPTFSVTDEICGGERCELLVGDAFIYADAGHLTTAFTSTQVPALAAWLEELVAGAGDGPRTAPSSPPTTGSSLDGDLVAMLAVAEAEAAERAETCTVEQTSPSGIEYCEGGDLDAERSVLLVGDSHARHWTGAMDAAASEAGVRLYHRWRGACPALAVTIDPGEGDPSLVEACEQHREDTRTLVDELEPDLVVISNAYLYDERVRDGGDVVDAGRAAELWQAALAGEVAALRDAGAAVAVIEDNPHLTRNPVTCVRDVGDVAACQLPADEVLDHTRPMREATAAVVEAEGLPAFSVTEVICGSGTCEVVRDGAFVYVDAGHLSTAFTASQVPALSAWLAEALGG